MADTYRVRDAADVEAALAWAVAEETAFEIVASGSKRNLGRPVKAARTLDVSGLKGIGLYEPEELVLRAGPGTPLADIQATLAAKGQHLAFEPPELGALLGSSAAPTLGGAVAANLSGPRRPAAGALRDHILGIAAVSGRGEAFKVGGRVMKNVTGYDLPKLLAGSFGTLAVLTEVTIKVLPRPAAQLTLAVAGLGTRAALASLRWLAAAAIEPSGLAFLPAATLAHLPAARQRGLGGDLAFVRLEGPERGIAVRAERAIELARREQPSVTADRLDPSAGEALWREIGGGLAFAGAAFTGWDVWRLSVAPTGAAAIADRLTADGPGAVQFDWGGGLLWYAHPPRRRRHEAIREAIVANGGGHATLIRATAETRAVVPVFEPQPPAMAALTARIKHAFDPRAVLNPGRMYEGV